MAWTDDRIETLKNLWLAGRSASQCARELGDVTRNAVISKVHRLGIADAGRARPSAPPTRRAPRPAAPHPPPRPVAERVAPPPAIVAPTTPKGGMKTLVNKGPKECCWPMEGEGENTLFCCAPADGPYCPDHHKQAYQTPARPLVESYFAQLGNVKLTGKRASEPHWGVDGKAA